MIPYNPSYNHPYVVSDVVSNCTAEPITSYEIIVAFGSLFLGVLVTVLAAAMVYRVIFR